MSLSPPANLFLAHRLSIEEFERDVVSARNADHAKSSPSHRNAIGLVDASKEQVVEVRGFGADAIEAIKVATNGEQEILTTTYVVERSLASVIEQVEDLLRIPSKHWRLTTEDDIMVPEDKLVYRVLSNPVGLLLIPEDTVVHYLADNKHVHEYKRLKPNRVAATTLPDPRAHAQAAFHLLAPQEHSHWDDYAAQRRNAEWTFAQMLARSSDEDFVEFFTFKIKHSVENILRSTQLGTDEQKAVADGVLPQGLEVEDDDNEGSDLLLAECFTRVFSPSQPTVMDVYLDYMDPDYKIFYRIYDPAPPAEERLKIFNIRGADKPKKPHYKGWSLLCAITPKRKWGLTPSDAQRIREVLFGPLGNKVSTLDAVLFVMASVGIHVELRSEDPRGESEQDKLVRWNDGPDWPLGKNHVKWIGTNLRSACGDSSTAAEGRKPKRQRVN